MCIRVQILMNVHRLLVNTTVLILLGVLRAFVEKVMNSTVMEGPALVCICLAYVFTYIRQ